MDEFLKGLIYWFEKQDIEATVNSNDGKTADISLKVSDYEEDDEDEGDFFIGTYADPGLTVVWLGEFDLGDKTKDTLVRVNGIVMSALARSVVGWAVGLD